jgi:hypothetical protein
VGAGSMYAFLSTPMQPMPAEGASFVLK